MKEFFNIKKKYLIIIWFITSLITIGLVEDGYSSSQITLMTPIMLVYTLGWLSYKNNK